MDVVSRIVGQLQFMMEGKSKHGCLLVMIIPYDIVARQFIVANAKLF